MARSSTTKPTAKQPPSAKAEREDAQSMATRQREIAVSEFFAKNRHLLGFDNPHKALLTTIREAVDNALDACEEAGILPEIEVEIQEVSAARFRVCVRDNGPGIVKAQIGRIFGQLLYGSKFHRLKQSRGQQGIGISAAVMYGQMTTGLPAVVVSKTGKGRAANRLTLELDTQKNRPLILAEDVDTSPWWADRVSGTAIEIVLEASYKGGRHGVDAYLRQTGLSNPHATIRFTSPKGERFEFPRVVNALPPEPKEILPHPYGVELGTLLQMLRDTNAQTVRGFLEGSFSRVSSSTADEICSLADLSPTLAPSEADRLVAEKLYRNIQETKIPPPPTNCLSPIGEEAMVKGLYWLFARARADNASPLAEDGDDEDADDGQMSFLAPSDPAAAPLAAQEVVLDEDRAVWSESEGYFVTATTRPPRVYRGNPFQVEAGLFWGKGIPADGLARVYRFANRVPLQYQAAACAMTKSVVATPWRNYEVQQSKGALPTGPLVILVHIASAWVPYTSESKEAIAHYEDILKEMRLAVMDCGRRLQRFLRRRQRDQDEAKKRNYIHRYLNPIGEALQEILALSDENRDATLASLREILERSRGSKRDVSDDETLTPPGEAER